MNRYVSPVAPPNAYEDEVLKILAEECVEVAQRALKSSRFGITEAQPGQPHNNAYRLGIEVGQLLYMIRLGISLGMIDRTAVHIGEMGKPEALAKYMQHEPVIHTPDPAAFAKEYPAEFDAGVPTDGGNYVI